MALNVTLNMDIFDEIEVATIPFNQTTILEMKARIAELPLRWRLTTLVVWWRWRNLSKSPTASSEFLFYLLSLLHFLFSHFRSLRRGFLSSLVVNGRGKRRSAYMYPYQNTNVNEFETKAKYNLGSIYMRWAGLAYTYDTGLAQLMLLSPL